MSGREPLTKRRLWENRKDVRIKETYMLPGHDIDTKIATKPYIPLHAEYIDWVLSFG